MRTCVLHDSIHSAFRLCISALFSSLSCRFLQSEEANVLALLEEGVGCSVVGNRPRSFWQKCRIRRP